MPLPESVQARIAARHMTPTGPVPKRGVDIFNGVDYPRSWEAFIGQEDAKDRLVAASVSAAARGTRLDHILLDSGLHGIGKTTLAYILAYTSGRGLTAVSGPMGVEDARVALRSMQDGDILFWDELHLAVAGNRNRADWTLPFFTDGVLMTASGAEKMPEVSIVGATTDAGRLPQTILSRFMVRPKLVPYTEEEGVLIVRNLADRMGVPLLPEEEAPIARAANQNPREMRMILTAVRDLSFTPGTDERVDLKKAFEWAGTSYDGITSVAQDMLLLLLTSSNYTSAITNIQATLGEPGPLRHHEQLLLRKGLLTVTGQGRVLTDEGVARAERLVMERGE